VERGELPPLASANSANADCARFASANARFPAAGRGENHIGSAAWRWNPKPVPLRKLALAAIRLDDISLGTLDELKVLVDSRWARARTGKHKGQFRDVQLFGGPDTNLRPQLVPKSRRANALLRSRRACRVSASLQRLLAAR